MVALVHDSGDAEDEENDILLNGLSHQSHLILRAEGLATGFCRDVHGQVCRGWVQDSPGPQAAHLCAGVQTARGTQAAGLSAWEAVRMQVTVCSRGCLVPCTMGIFHVVPSVSRGELLKRRQLSGLESRGPATKQQNPSVGQQQALYIQVNMAPFKIVTWGGRTHGRRGCCLYTVFKYSGRS